MTFPTGDEQRDLGRGETSIAPFLTTWHDLGSCRPCKWNTLQLNVGPEFGLRSGDRSVLYTAVFAHSFLAPRILFPHAHSHGHNGNGHAHCNGQGSHRNGHSHDNGHANEHRDEGGTISIFGPMYPIGLMSVIFEFNGQTECQADRLTLLQLLSGFSYVLTETAEIRFGVNVPLNRRELQTDAQYIFAFTYIF
jgi:hypothetical protein